MHWFYGMIKTFVLLNICNRLISAFIIFVIAVAYENFQNYGIAQPSSIKKNREDCIHMNHHPPSLHVVTTSCVCACVHNLCSRHFDISTRVT